MLIRGLLATQAACDAQTAWHAVAGEPAPDNHHGRKNPISCLPGMQWPASLRRTGTETEDLAAGHGSRDCPCHDARTSMQWPASLHRTGTETEAEAPHNPLQPVPAAAVTLGKPADFPTYGWDNEYGERAVAVGAFEASKFQVTNGELLEFVKAGGYREEGLWTADGWRWCGDTPVFSLCCARVCQGAGLPRGAPLDGRRLALVRKVPLLSLVFAFGCSVLECAVGRPRRPAPRQPLRSIHSLPTVSHSVAGARAHKAHSVAGARPHKPRSVAGAPPHKSRYVTCHCRRTFRNAAAACRPLRFICRLPQTTHRDLIRTTQFSEPSSNEGI